jgi:hypothetical protein
MTVGEILDRAITTYVRRCLPLFVILALAVVPVSLVQLAGAPGFVHMSELFAQMNRLPPADVFDRNRLLTEALGSINAGSLFAIFIVGPLILYPLARNAILTYANGGLEGSPVSMWAAYRVSFPRWGAQVVTTVGYAVLQAATVIVLLIGALMIMGAIIVPVVLVNGGRGNATFSTGVVLVVALVFMVVGLLAVALLNVALELATVSVALEEPNPFRAIGNGWRRTFDRTLLRRTVGVALAYFAVEALGTGAFVAAGALLAALTHSYIVQTVVSDLAYVVIDGVLLVFMLVYALDLRMRREGLDLLRAAGEPSTVP